MVSGMSAMHELYVPCILSPWYAPPFTIDPVTFTHIRGFVVQGGAGMGIMFDTAFEQVFHEMSGQDAHWMATIEIDKCTKDRAWELEELAVGIVLVGIQLVVPLHHSQHMARMTARTIPRYRQAVSRSNGAVSVGGANQQPGLSMGEGTLEHFLANGNRLLQAVGPRITSFLARGGNLASLEQAWADAAYWFHEGLAEPLDTIGVPKLETAIEVLLRSESKMV
jgi:hypothetical protein